MKQETAQRIVEENKRVYNRIARHFSGTRSHPWGEFTLFEPYVKTGNQILDIGCGNGRLAGFFEQKKINYTGVDNSAALIDIAKQAHPAATFLVSEATQLLFSDGQFDVVCSIATLHHIPSRELRAKAIREAVRVLKPGGYLLITEWNLWHPQWWKLLAHYSWRKFTGQSDLDWGDVEKPWKDARGTVQGMRYLHPFSRRQMARLCTDQGCTLVYQEYTTQGVPTRWYRGYNLVTICQKH
ncbi:MAG: methyltransferase domain-containing protein [Patescibacteria group bacterium]